MTKYILALSFLMLFWQLNGQMLPVSANYLNNILAFNPAYSGSQDALSVTISYRNQWAGFKGAPENSLISFHAPFNNDKVGLGFVVERNSFGINRETRFCGNYSYRIEFYEGILAMGLGFGATVHNIAWNELEAVESDDFLLYENPAKRIVPYFNLGLYYYTSDYFAGFSIPVLFNDTVEKNSASSWLSGNNFFLTGGYNFRVNTMLRLQPSVLVKVHSQHPAQIDLNAQAILKERFRIGLGYRSNSILVSMLQLQLNPQLRMAYSYDYDLGPIGRYTSGSHEVMLNYVFSYYRRVVGPRQF